MNPADLPEGSRSCLRDLSLGDKLSVAYRLSNGLLTRWRELDAAIIAYVDSALEVRD